MELYTEKDLVLIHQCHDQLLSMSKATETTAEKYQIGLKQGIILKMLLEQDKLTQKEITRRLEVSSSAAGSLIEKLSFRGLVIRQQDSADKRTFIVSLTEEGSQIAQEYRAQSSQSFEELDINLNSTEKKELFKLLTKLSKGLKKIKESEKVSK